MTFTKTTKTDDVHSICALINVGMGKSGREENIGIIR
jgi:hypothetical protein